MHVQGGIDIKLYILPCCKNWTATLEEELYCEIGKAHDWFAVALAFDSIELECSTGFVCSFTLYFKIVENIHSTMRRTKILKFTR